MSTAGRRYRHTRKTVQVMSGLAWLSLPLTGALQIDLPHLHLKILGRAWPPLTPGMLPHEALQRGAAPHWELIGPALAWTIGPVAFFAIAFLLTARYLGRVHCGFTCFYGFLAETGEAFWRWARRPGPGRSARVALFLLAVILAAPAMAFEILSLVATPRGVWAGLAGHDPAIAVPFAVFTLVAVVMGLFVRLRFCRYVCGVGLLQSAAWMTNAKALQMGFHSAPAPVPAAPALPAHGTLRDCTGCHGCRDVCPIGFDPRAPKRSMMACFQCGECLVRCEEELHPLGKGAAIGLHLYDPGFPLAAHAGRQGSPSLVAMAKGKAPQAD